MSNRIRRPGLATALLATTTGLTLLTVACGASPSATSPSVTSSGSTPAAAAVANSQPSAPSALAFARCVRAHGVPNFPDPPAHFMGKFPGAKPDQLGVSATLLRTAIGACQNLLPPEPGQPPITAQDRQDYLRAAACMRAHGVTIFPDPVFSGGGVSIPTPAGGIDTSSPQFVHAAQICRRLIPAGLPYSS
jgi:hypothetical protein